MICSLSTLKENNTKTTTGLENKGVKSAHDPCVIFDRVKSRLDPITFS